MLPSIQEAEEALVIAGKMNPGPWIKHSKNVGIAAKAIADKCSGMDSSKAYIVGLLHDIGRRVGIVSTKHVIAGYEYAMEKGWDEVARVCMTHSYPTKDESTEIGHPDITEEEGERIRVFLEQVEYDSYDKLIILCDSLATAKGCCLLEKRFVDTTRRYGVFPFTIERWNATFAIKAEFEAMMEYSIYEVLPHVKETTFLEEEVWVPTFQ